MPTLKNTWIPKGTGRGGGSGWVLQDGNFLKVGYNDGGTTINTIKFTELF